MVDKKNSKERSAATASLNSARETLKERLDAIGGDVCLERVLIALSNEEVQESFLDHVLDNEAFSKAYCLGSLIPEEDRIIFEFVCVPPKICLFPMRFLVRLNIITGNVEEVIDPAPAWIPVGPAAPGAVFRLV